MNPPFGEPVEGTRPYLKAAYPWIPTKDHNLLAAFVGRGIELCNDSGYLGAITSRAGMFLTTFEAWRKEVLLGHRLMTLADLGFGVSIAAGEVRSKGIELEGQAAWAFAMAGLTAEGSAALHFW